MIFEQIKYQSKRLIPYSPLPIPYSQPTQVSSIIKADHYTSIESLPSREVGTIIEVYEQEEYYLVEFTDTEGCEYAMATLRADEILVLHYDLAIA